MSLNPAPPKGMSLTYEEDPVAWLVVQEGGPSLYMTDDPTKIPKHLRGLPLYTHPIRKDVFVDEDIKPTFATEEQLRRARESYAQGSDDCIAVDDDAQTSQTNDGVWVQAWVWLGDPIED